MSSLQDDDESRPLLARRKTSDGKEPVPSSIAQELWILTKASIPVALSYMLQNSLQTLSVVVVGRLGPSELSAAAFSYMLSMVTAFCVALGGTTALDTLASALYTSSSHPTDVGVVLQRALLALFVVYLPFAVLWWFSHPVLLALGQGDELARNVQAFLRVLSFGAPGYIGFECVKKFLQVQGIMHVSTLVLVITSPLNVLLNYILVHHTALRLLGAPLATGISYWLSFGLLSLYCKYSEASKCWGGWDKRCLKAWWPFLKLALPGILMVGTEWWAFEIVALMAGRLGELPLAAQSVIMTVDQILNTLPFGIGVASSSRVGNLLGLKSPSLARISSLASVLLSTVIGTLILILLLSTRSQFGYLFSDDPSVVSLVASVLPYVAAFQIADGWANSCGGVLRGMGRQHVGALVNLVAYYAIALPGGIALAFKGGMGLQGLWIGQCVALFLVGLGEFGLVWRTRWEVEVERASDRIKEDEFVQSVVARGEDGVSEV